MNVMRIYIILPLIFRWLLGHLLLFTNFRKFYLFIFKSFHSKQDHKVTNKKGVIVCERIYEKYSETKTIRTLRSYKITN